MKQASQNLQWFERNKAFSYLEKDKDNKIRIQKVINYLTNIKNKTTLRLLDVGCGDGLITEKFLKLGFIVYGFDISAKNIALAKNKGVKARVSDASNKFPYENSFFDVIFAGEIIEHLYDTKFFLDEVNRVLTPNGLLVITTPNLTHLPDRVKFLLGKSPTQVNPLHEFIKFYIRPFTYDMLALALTKHNFRIAKFESSLVVFGRSKGDPNFVTSSSKLLADLFPTLGSFLIIYARKN